jgi:DNA polymerase-3 subunit epsilon
VGLGDLFRRRGPTVEGLPAPQPCDFIAVDFETANSTRGSACAVGVAVVADSRVIAEGATLIDPEMPFDGYCSMVNGLDEAAVKGAPTLPQVWPVLSALLDGQLVVAHNASFDMAVMRNAGARYGVTSGPTFEVLCTYRMARAAWPQLPSYSLGYVAPLCGIEFDHHEAGQDARAAARVAVALYQSVGAPSLRDGLEGLRVVPGRMTHEAYQPCELPRLSSLTSAEGYPDADPNHPLYGRSMCFTGTLLSMPRRDAQARIVDVGCTFKNSVGKKLNYLVLGDGDFALFADGHRTGKLDKAMELREAGAPIEIIPERDFLALLLSEA